MKKIITIFITSFLIISSNYTHAISEYSDENYLLLPIYSSDDIIQMQNQVEATLDGITLVDHEGKVYVYGLNVASRWSGIGNINNVSLFKSGYASSLYVDTNGQGHIFSDFEITKQESLNQLYDIKQICVSIDGYIILKSVVEFMITDSPLSIEISASCFILFTSLKAIPLVVLYIWHHSYPLSFFRAVHTKSSFNSFSFFYQPMLC